MNKKLIRLTEQDLHRIVKESVNKVLKEESNISYEYEQLYDNIQSVTNDISNFVGWKLMNNEVINEQTKMLFDSLADAASKLSNIAHEVEEHLAWDIKQPSDQL